MPAEPVGAATGKIHILVVEDDPSTYIALRQLLEHYGFLVTHATTTAQAVAMLSSNPKYVLLDLMLPDGDGARVLEHVRREKLPIKVAVITAISDPIRLQRVEQLGPDALLSKPLDLIKLLEQIKPNS